MTALLPERAGCPQCGSLTGRRWRSYSGIELCTDCEWDYFSELNGRKMLDARSQLGQPVVPRVGARSIRKSGQPVPNPLQVRSKVDHHAILGSTGSPSRLQQPPDDKRCRRVPPATWQAALAELVKPGYNSVCLLCGRIYYGAAMSSCSRCGGMCVQRSDHDLGLMGRHGQQLVEAERDA